ncbi:DUF1642 domain-containing protein [Enterococcus avium]|uniref:DUF1642 domain-containing protein n=1 Tax=Enterococcus avium TaxID=33945 RepID=UPI00288ED904|nr:DUF1642 domain-containing protein [Enterococcus avium]MDT2451059.1 DUF1642 domain-containing protein [Enterococcus avium]
MEIREVIEKIKQEKYDFSKPWTSLDRSDYKEGYNDACDDILDIIFKQLDEPQKVKVPAFVAEWFEENKHNLNFAIYELCEAGKVPVDLYEGLTDFERWFYLNHDIDTLIRMQDGYEVEEEPKWVVKVGNLYFCGWEDTTAQFVMNTVLGEDESIIKYKNEGTASSVAKNLGGTAEKA